MNRGRPFPGFETQKKKQYQIKTPLEGVLIRL